MPVKPERKFVDQFITELNIPKSYFSVRSGPKRMYWATVSSDDYYVVIHSSLFNYKPEVYNLLSELTYKRDMRQSYPSFKYVISCTDDTNGGGLRSYSGNLGFVIEKFTGSDISRKSRNFIEKNIQLSEDSLDDFLIKAQSTLDKQHFEEVNDVLKASHIL